MGSIRRTAYVVTAALLYVAMVYLNPVSAQTRSPDGDFRFEASVSAECFARFGMSAAAADCATEILTPDQIDRCFEAADDGVGCFGENPILAAMIRIRRDLVVFQSSKARGYLFTAFR